MLISRLCLLILIFSFHIGLQADEYFIASVADSGPGSLREAMLIVMDDDVITFDSNLSGTITLGSSLPTITAENLTIIGPASMTVAIDGSSLFQIFNIAADRVKISNLVLRNGASPTFGGAIFVQANLNATATNVTIHAGMGTDSQSPLYLDNEAFINFINPSFVGGAGADISFSNASAILKNNNTLIAPTIYIDGLGILATKGAGGINLFAVSNPIALFIYNQSGTCGFSGTTSSAVIANGRMTGNFTAQYIGNTGSIEPGDGGIGTIISTSDYDQSSDGNLQIKIDPSGENDLVSVSGNFSPQGILTLLPQSGTYMVGTSYTIVTTEGNVNNSFPSVICPIVGFPFITIYHPTSIEILITKTTTVPN